MNVGRIDVDLNQLPRYDVININNVSYTALLRKNDDLLVLEMRRVQDNFPVLITALQAGEYYLARADGQILFAVAVRKIGNRVMRLIFITDLEEIWL